MSSWYRAERKPRSEGRFRNTNGNVAAIDFGTTFCSLAYITAGDDKVATIKLNDYDTRVPTAILLRPNGDGSEARDQNPSYEVVHFGDRAQKGHSKMKTKDQERCLYFERIKMNLQHDKDVNRDMTIKAFNGQEFYLVEVIAFILKYLKEQLEKKYAKTPAPLKAADFDWVITVPAIWKARGKRMMREAGYMAGLCSPGQAIDRLSRVERDVPKPKEVNPDKLSLALEPEAAAIFCQQLNTHVAKYCDATKVLKSDSYLVLDIGGGTVDITAHQLDSSRGMEVLAVPSGNDWGGTKVNKEFSKFLQKLVNDEDNTDTYGNDFPRFVSQCKPNMRPAHNRAVINQFIYNEFEDQKKTFGETNGEVDDDIAVKLPAEFVRFYGSDFITSQVEKLGDDRVSYAPSTEILYIHYSKAQQFFKPAVDGIIDCTIPLLNKFKGQIDTIYLVGGFGGCKYIYEKVAAQVKTRFGEKAFRLIVPSEPSLAVAQGAVLYRKNPDVISSRRVDATYGIDVIEEFEAGKHDVVYRFYDVDRVARCANIFEVFMEVGEVARASEVVTSTVIPGASDSVVMHMDIYSTFEKGVRYTTSNGRSTVRKIGELIIDIPNHDNLPRDEREIEIMMDFSHTEIQAQAKYLVTGAVVKTTVDFLSAS